MLYSFAPVSAVLKLRVDDYYHNCARRRLRLHEKGGNEHEMPVHHLLEQILDEYIVALLSGQPLFQRLNSLGTAVTGRALNRYNAWAAIRKRAKTAGFLTPVGCHTWCQTQSYLRIGQRYLRLTQNPLWLHVVYCRIDGAAPQDNCLLQLRWPLRSNCFLAVLFDGVADAT